MCDMFGTYTHSVFNHEIKIEPISFYGCYQNYPGNSSMKEAESKVENLEDISKDDQELEFKKKKNTSQICKICGKVLSSPSSYYVHMKQHSDSKPYHCPCCDASFCRKPYLEVHMRTHTGEKPFECSVCKKRFTQKSSLNTHKRVHTGERPYVCEICSKSFAVKSYLQAHQWSHMKGSGLPCSECHLIFNSKNHYIQHIRTHNISKQHECVFCKRTFAKDSYLIRHVNKVHKDVTLTKINKNATKPNSVVQGRDFSIVQCSRTTLSG